MADRAQSEVLGFVLMFAVVIAAIAVVSATAFAGLLEARDTTQVDNVARSVEVLADNVDDLVTGRAPARATELRLVGGRLVMADPVTVSVSGHVVGNASANFSYGLSVRPLVYDAPDGEGTIRYVAGAVVRTDAGGGAVLLEEPPVVLATDGAVVSVIQTRAVGQQSVGGRGAVLVRTVRSDAATLVADQRPHVLNVTVETPHADAWVASLGDADAVNCTVTASGGAASCRLTTDRATVTVVRTDVSLR